jgi:PKHD-type hydroxylase
MYSVYNSSNDVSRKHDLDPLAHYTFYNVFSKEEINSIIQLSSAVEQNVATIMSRGDMNTTLSYRSSQIKWLEYNNETEWIFKKLSDCIVQANNTFWNFHLIGFGEHLQFTEYYASENGKYDWHLDVGDAAPHRKLSVTVQLTDENDYEGGEFKFLKGKDPETIEKAIGSVTVFPSYLLHCVSPVTKGVRRSLVCWITGEPFV